MAHDCCSSEHSAHPTPAAALFPPEEVAAFHQDDRHTAAVIVCLMVGIFTMGLALYLGIAIWVA